MELDVIVVRVFALAFIPVIVLRLGRASTHERAIDVDVVENCETELIWPSAISVWAGTAVSFSRPGPVRE